MKRNILALLVGGLLTANGAYAQTADLGWYIGVGAGASSYSNDIPKQIANGYANNTSYTLTDARTKDDSDTAAQLFVGYKFLPWLGVELGYQHLGEARVHYDLAAINSPTAKKPSVDGRYRASDVNAVLVASWPVGEQFELLARGGVSDVRLSYDERGMDVRGNAFSTDYGHDDSTHPQFGLGVLWKFAPAFSLRADWDRNFNVGKKWALTPDTNGRFDNIDAFTLNLIWKP